jgi:hypothetical protein
MGLKGGPEYWVSSIIGERSPLVNPVRIFHEIWIGAPVQTKVLTVTSEIAIFFQAHGSVVELTRTSIRRRPFFILRFKEGNFRTRGLVKWTKKVQDLS